MLNSLRKVLGCVHAQLVETACLRLPLTRDDIGADGTMSDAAAPKKIGAMLDSLAATVAQGQYPS